MSDIYYCSNSKSKKTSNGSSASDKSPKTLATNNNNNNNSNNNNNICGKHTTVNGKPMWNAKGLQNGNSNQKSAQSTVSPDVVDGVTIATPQKAFHNTRCTRHHKSHHTQSPHNHHGSSSDHLSSHHHIGHHMQPQNHHSHSNGHRRKSESVLSTDSDIRFTRRKLGDSQKCGCAVIAGFLVALLVAGVLVYVGYTYFKPEPLPDRVFRGKFLLLNDKWSMDLANQKSLRFQQKARDYREGINLLIRRSDLRESYEGSEILALDGTENMNDVIVHFNMIFDPYAELVTTSDLLALFAEEINSPYRKSFANMTIEPHSLTIKEVTGLPEEPIISSSPLGRDDETTEVITTTPKPPRRCEPLRLNYCRHVGYNTTTYPNLLGHTTLDEVQADVIAFRELVDAECFREAFDFVCRLLQPPCDTHGANVEPTAGAICREYCQMFMKGCGNRLPQRFKRYFDCEQFPESTGILSCHQKPRCANDLQTLAQSPRLCDGIADCPDLSDERTCSFCNANSLYCGRGRACVSRKARCDGKADCPDGSDEKDCLSIAPLAADLKFPEPLVPYLPRFHAEGFAVFSEKGTVGKLCAEGLDGSSKLVVRQTVAESLCKSLGYESVERFEVINDTESVSDYVRVLDPHAPEISFIRTHCPRREVLYVGCGELQCGIQSVLTAKQHLSLPKVSLPGDWPWLAALYREDIHVCDGTLISQDWVLTTESCFQGQPRATWMAIFGSVRLTSNAPWTQRRRIIGMVKSPVEGSTAALIRLETPVVYSDHVRPICLPDELQRKSEHTLRRRMFTPQAERLAAPARSTMWQRANAAARPLLAEMQQYFVLPPPKLLNGEENSNNDDDDEAGSESEQSAEAAASFMPRAEALTVEQHQLNPLQPNVQLDVSGYPLPENTPQVHYYSGTRQPTRSVVGVQTATSSSSSSASTKVPVTPNLREPHRPEEVWTNCNTLGWSRQRDQLQRVQLKIGDMAPCENVSIATVNSMCTEATYQKNDCSQEEFSGAPVQCLIPGSNQWALIGVSSWRIACGPTSGVERPRMYDKISSNAAWIRDTIATA